MKQLLALAMIAVALPATALETIGTVTAALDGATLSFEVLQSDDGSAMVQVNDIGPLTMIDLTAMGDGDIYVQLIFQDPPAIDVPPVGLAIEIRPEGIAGPVWRSEGTAMTPEFRFERLVLTGEGRMEASFTATLCRGDAPSVCQPVEGRIDTDLGAP